MSEITDIPRACPHDKLALRAEIERGRVTDPGLGVSEIWLITVRYACELGCTELRQSKEQPTAVIDTAGFPLPIKFTSPPSSAI